MADGFAYINRDGLIDVSTVSATERAAMVNAIVMVTDGAVIPLETWTEQRISEVFRLMIETYGGELSSVKITAE